MWSRNAMWNFIVGGRGIGKTYGSKKHAIRAYLKTGETFIYLRRTEEELKAAKPTVFKDIAGAFPDFLFRVNGVVGEIARKPESDKEKPKYSICCYFLALSTAGNVKSVPYNDVTLIIFDEIFANNDRYLPMEHEAFQEFYATVDRWKDKTRVLFLSNSVKMANPYFLAYNIIPNGKRFQLFEHGYILFENVDSGGFALKVRKTRFGQLIQNQEYAKYAIDNKFKDDSNELIADPPRSKLNYTYTIETNGGSSFSVYVWKNENSDQYNYFVSRRTPKQKRVFVDTPSQVTAEKRLIDRKDDRCRRLVDAYRNSMMMFESPQMRSVGLMFLRKNM